MSYLKYSPLDHLSLCERFLAMPTFSTPIMQFPLKLAPNYDTVHRANRRGEF